MICPRCLLTRNTRMVVNNPLSKTTSTLNSGVTTARTFSTTSKVHAAPSSTSASTTPSRSPPAATSTAAAQPFSTPAAPSASPSTQDLKSVSKSSPKSPAPPSHLPPGGSSVPAGTILKGLNYFKNKQDPLAMADEEYPPWLWTVLAPKEKMKTSSLGAGRVELDPRVFAKSAGARRQANKAARKEAASAARSGLDKVVRVPVYEQSVDLAPEEDARKGLTKALREKRRRDIKTANFLKGI